ncbi:MAG: aspartate-semialdehyde dehydrogenase [Bdellovibrionaceae bacterium]|nr:aspartate-semialdehyde dehydrogenase [Pseudobdellovibrionaceae bacterium]
MAKKLKVGVVGATGMVGQTFMNIMEERKFPFSELRPFASETSAGKQIHVQGQDWTVQALKPGCFAGLDLVFFSSGDDISKEWAPEAVRSGAFAVDNSAAFRMDSSKHLIVPEVNSHLLGAGSTPQVIANPNCSTIQLVVALKPLAEKFGLEEVRVASYQAVSGAGIAGYDELLAQTADFQNTEPLSAVFPHPILFNAIPQIGSFNSEGFCSEEVKIMQETRKILNLPQLKVSAFTVRIPALNAHSEAVWVTLQKEASREQILRALAAAPGIVVQDEVGRSIYPTARNVSGADPVYVGRVHRDPENPYLWLMWVVSDNIRKGAALNGMQIAEHIFDIKYQA